MECHLLIDTVRPIHILGRGHE